MAHVASADAAPRWKFVASHAESSGSDAFVFFDLNSLLRSGKLVRGWVMTDFSEFKEGDWAAPAGESKAYMSALELVVVDCATKDFGYGTWVAKSERKGQGPTVYTNGRPVPTVARSPSIPGSVGELLAEAMCKATR